MAEWVEQQASDFHLSFMKSKCLPILLYGSEARPYGSEAIPYGLEAVAYRSEAIPYGSEEIPYGSEAIPYGSKAIPYGSEALSFNATDQVKLRLLAMRVFNENILYICQCCCQGLLICIGFLPVQYVINIRTANILGKSA